MSSVNKQIAREIFLGVLERIQVERMLERKLRREGDRLWIEHEAIELAPFERVQIISFGKAAAPMARALDRLFDDRLPRQTQGIIVSPPRGAPVAAEFPGYRCFVGGHPYPNEQSLVAAEAILKTLKRVDEQTLVLFLISGGGSALVEKPIAPLTFEDLVETYRVLVRSGARIEEINGVRKHLSVVKGGRLAIAAHPATVLTLLISDVPEGALSTIASGPSLPDESTTADCYRFAETRGLLEQLPSRVRDLFVKHELPETPKPGDVAFARSHAFVLLSSKDAVEAAAEGAREKGMVVAVDNSVDDWPLAQAADHLLGRVDELRKQNPGHAVCLISAGELVCPVTGSGQGGRNQAFVLYCVPRIAEQAVVVLSGGTDGVDGNSPAAGAIADGKTLARARALALDPRALFAASDSWHFFQALGDTIETGPTSNNVRDLRLILAE